MPEQSQRPPTTKTPQQETPARTRTVLLESNSDRLERLALEAKTQEKTGPVAIVQEWLQEATTSDSLAGYAESAVGSAMHAVADGIGGLDETPEEGVAEIFGDALEAQTAGLATEWLSTADGRRLVERIQGMAEDPKDVAVVGLLAASAFVLANRDVELSHEIELAEDWSLELGLDLGRIREIAVEEASVRLRYQRAALKIDLGVEKNFETDDVRAKLGVAYRW